MQNTEKENKQKKACRCEAFVCAFTYFTRKTSLFRIRAHSPMTTSTSSSALHCGINFAYEIQFVVTQRRHKCMWFYIVVKYISVLWENVARPLVVLFTFKWIEKYFLLSCLSIMALPVSSRSSWKQICLGRKSKFDILFPIQKLRYIICLLVLWPTFQSDASRFKHFSHTAVGPVISSFYDSSGSLNMTSKVPIAGGSRGADRKK